MANRSVQDALTTLDEVNYPNAKTETDYTHAVNQVVHDQVQHHAEIVAQQARGLGERFDGYAASLSEVAVDFDSLQTAVLRGQLDPVQAQQRFRALDVRRELLMRVVDERDNEGRLRLASLKSGLVAKLEDPVASLDDLQSRYPSLRRPYNH